MARRNGELQVESSGILLSQTFYLRTKLKKPTLQKRECFDYNDVIHFIEKKYGFDSRDYKGHFKKSHDAYVKVIGEHGFTYKHLGSIKPADMNPKESEANRLASEAQKKAYDDNPYCDFWHWVIDKNDHISNGSYFSLSFEGINDPPTEFMPDWVQEILRLIKSEFSPDSDEMEFSVSW